MSCKAAAAFTPGKRLGPSTRVAPKADQVEFEGKVVRREIGWREVARSGR
jgi:hypothetical protein